MRQEGLPWKHELSCGMVYRHMAIRCPPEDAFLDFSRVTSEDKKEMVSAWLVLKEHILEPWRTNANWTHADVTFWVKDDVKSRHL